MSGSNTPLIFAERLKQIADSKHQGEVNKDVESIVKVVLVKAEKAAQAGSYSVEYYDERLGAKNIDDAVKRLLREQGFKVEVAEDHDYSAHVGHTMMFVRATWK